MAKEAIQNEQQLLYSRAQTARALGGISTASIVRLEKRGKLTPIRLTNGPTGQVFHAVDEVRALARA